MSGYGYAYAVTVDITARHGCTRYVVDGYAAFGVTYHNAVVNSLDFYVCGSIYIWYSRNTFFLDVPKIFPT